MSCACAPAASNAANATPAALGSLGPGFFAAETLVPTAAGAALASGAGPTAGTSASGSGEVASSATNPYANEAVRLSNVAPGATSPILDTTLPFASTAAKAASGNALSDYLTQANDFLKSPVGQIGTSLVSGYLGNRAANNAADAQRDAANAAIAEQRRQYDQTRTDLSPWRERGVNASNRLGALMGLSGNTSDPYYGKGIVTAPRYTPQSQNRLSQMMGLLNNRAGVR